MLLKNVLQTFRKKWPQLLAVGLIIYFSSFIYSSMFYAISGLEKPTLRYLDEYVQEDFSFEMISVLTSEEIAWLRNEHNLPEEIYSLADLAESQPVILNLILQERKKILSDLFSGINLETRQFKDFYFNANGEEHRALIIKDSDRINLSYIETGHFPQDSRQIALTRVYAEKNGLNIGDAISLQGITYEISGFVLFPDYTYAVLDQSFAIDNEKLTLFLANDAVYDIVRGQTGFRLAGIFREQPNREE